MIRVILLIFCLSSATAKESIPQVRVKIADSLRKILITGTDLVRKDEFSTKLIPGKKGIYFNCTKTNTQLSERKNKVLVASLESKTGVMSLNNSSKYSGALEIISDINKESCDVVQNIDLENYLASLLSKEMNKEWPLEVLKAQAVAARSYAYYKIKNQEMNKEGRFFDIESSEKHQVSGSFDDITFNTKKAAGETEGMILTDSNGRVSPVFFHARCGGKTLIPQQVWQNSIPAYKSVGCQYCQGSGKRIWNKQISMERMREFLMWMNRTGQISISNELIKYSPLMTSPDTLEKLVLRVYVGKNPISVDKTLFRKYFGVVQVESNRFAVSIQNSGVQLRGNGLGHGVGLCQVGALHLAKNGLSYQQILKTYFPGHKLVKVY